MAGFSLVVLLSASLLPSPPGYLLMRTLAPDVLVDGSLALQTSPSHLRLANEPSQHCYSLLDVEARPAASGYPPDCLSLVKGREKV